MQKIDELIQRFSNGIFEEMGYHTVAKLKMVNTLMDDLTDSKDIAYMEEIICQLAEILEWQDDTIADMVLADAKAAGFGPYDEQFVAVSRKPSEADLNPFTPPQGGFRDHDQVKKAFTNYLTYHVERKTKAGKDKPFSVHTIYDYSSRIKVLWEIAYAYWESSNGDCRIQLNSQNMHPGCTFLNAYGNIEALNDYIAMQARENDEIARGFREATPNNPLQNPRNLANTTAALAKFEEFVNAIGSKSYYIDEV